MIKIDDETQMISIDNSDVKFTIDLVKDLHKHQFNDIDILVRELSYIVESELKFTKSDLLEDVLYMENLRASLKKMIESRVS